MAATNAGGTTAVRFGSTRAQVVGMEAVLPSGAVVSRLRGLLKDNVGYDLPGLLVGSEGTLAVITRVRLRLIRPPPAAGDGADGAAGDRRGRGRQPASCWRVPSVEAVELMLQSGMRLACDHLGRPLPMPGAAPRLPAGRGRGRRAPGGCPGGGGGRAGRRRGRRGGGRRRRPRARCGRCARATRWRSPPPGIPPHKLDVTLPPGLLAEFIPRCDGAVAGLDPVVPRHTPTATSATATCTST